MQKWWQGSVFGIMVHNPQKKKKGLRLEAEATVHTCHLSLLSTKRALLTCTHLLEYYYERGWGRSSTVAVGATTRKEKRWNILLY